MSISTAHHVVVKVVTKEMASSVEPGGNAYIADVVVCGYLRQQKSIAIPIELRKIFHKFYFLNGIEFPPYQTGDMVEDDENRVPVPLPGEFTIMGFVKPSCLQTDRMIFSRDECGVGADQFRLSVCNNYLVLFASGGPRAAPASHTCPWRDGNSYSSLLHSATALEVGRYTHVALVVVPEKCSLYLDGLFSKEAYNTKGIRHKSKLTFRIGSRHRKHWKREAFQGSLTQFVFHEIALSRREIRAAMNQGQQ